MSLIDKAKEFAEKAHAGQLRKDGITPYIEHPKIVVQLCKKYYCASEDVLCAAYLHDVIEEAGVEVENLVQSFNNNIANMVVDLTKSRHESKIDYYKRLSKYASDDTKYVKLCDRLANIRDTLDLVRNNPSVENIDFGKYYIGDTFRLLDLGRLPIKKHMFIFNELLQYLNSLSRRVY